MSDPKQKLIDEFSAAKADREEKKDAHLEARRVAQEADRAYSAACDRYDEALDAMVKAL